MHYFSHYRQAIIAAIVGLTLSLALTASLRYVDNKNIRAHLQDELMTLRSEISREIQSYMFGLTWLARLHSSTSVRTSSSWLEEGPIIQAYYPNFSSFLWVNSEGIIEATYPNNFAPGVVGTAFHTQTGITIRNYPHNRRYLLPAGKLQQHLFDMLLVVSHLSTEPAGYYIANLNTQQLLETTLANYLTPGSQFKIIDTSDEKVRFEYTDSQIFYNNWRVSSPISFYEQELRFELYPSVARVQKMRSNLPLFFFLAGLFTTALVTFMYAILATSRVRAQELADTNLDLYSEIEERERVEKRMTYLASHDFLTGLANRHALIEHLKLVIHASHNQQKMVGALLIDLDNFKEVNDTLGHNLGDELLKAVAQRFKYLKPEEGVLARLGGDEFAITVPNITSVDVLETLASDVLIALEKPFIVHEYELFISTSIGIAITQNYHDDADDLIRNADTALYHAKELGRSTFHVYSNILHKELLERIELVKRLREAVDNEQLSVFYQPKVDMINHRIIGMEALVRWIDSDGSIIGPDTFIPLAEDTGLILPISEFVLRTACRQLKEWHELGFNELQLSVNLSGKQLQSPRLMSFILQVIEETDIPSHLLELELTEQVFIENIKSHTSFMHAVRDHGMTLAIDDFGVGYSSLSYLKHFPVNVLKIDRSFVQDLPDDKDDATITQTIINLANSLDLGLVAEGVETEEQIRFLTERGCTIGQGFFFSRPIPSAEMTALLTRYQGLVPIQID